MKPLVVRSRLYYTYSMSKPRTFRLSGLILTFIAVTVFLSLAANGVLLTMTEMRAFAAESRKLKQDYIEQKKAFLKEEVDSVLAYINGKRSYAEAIARANIKARVQEAADIAGQLSVHYKDRFDKARVREIVRETLRSIRFFNGRGYYFAFDRTLTEQLFPLNPSLEGKNMAEVRDSNGQPVVPDLLAIAETRGEGFYEYTWPMPGDMSTFHKKIAYVKMIPSIDWIVGVGEYPESVENDMKKEILEDLSSIRIKDAGYIFGGTYDGVSLLGPEKGNNMFELRDSQGKKIVQELIAAARKGGGFVEYVMPGFEGARPQPKISYAAPVENWGWYLGFGVYVHEIDNEIAAARERLQKTISMRIMTLSAVYAAVLLLALFAIGWFSLQFKKSYRLFYAFFRTSVFENKMLDLNKFRIHELREIAELTNNMVERKRTVDEALLRSLEERSALLKEVHHRVKNNFQAVASLFSLQKHSTDNREMQDFLDIAKNRMYTMVEVHEMLYQAEDYSSIKLQEYLDHIMKNLYQSLNLDRLPITVDFNVMDITFSIERAIPLGLILNELVTNSCKHAFRDRDQGRISVKLFTENGVTVLDYTDDGRGLPPSAAGPEQTQGFGFQIIEILSKQLEADMEMSSQKGFRLLLRIPVERKT
ncbi:MAG: cache domain-containing protein [Spirochaetales bacterium]|nr:cache domain-containing protein [Spirochaetales bacterium]